MEQEILTTLDTEQRNVNTMDIDRIDTKSILKKINAEDITVPKAISNVLDDITKVVDCAYNCITNGGRVIYIGAGTSGRLGVLDASECPPTYGVSSTLFQGVMAGGQEAMFHAKEGVEDDKEAGKSDIINLSLTTNDLVIGLAASGRTPYVIGALAYAKTQHIKTASISCVSHAKLSSIADFPIEIITGPEVVSGSTRMKAGTAQKLVLNMISTATMIKLGKVYQNYMIDVMPSNKKLVKRAINMIYEITQLTYEESEQLFYDSGQHVKTAIVMALCHVSKDEATQLLQQQQNVSKIFEQVQ